MPDGEDWLYRPILEGLCKYESLKDGSIDLEDIAIMNDALDCKLDNDHIFAEWQEQNNG